MATAAELLKALNDKSKWPKEKVTWNDTEFYVRMPSIGQKRELLKQLGVKTANGKDGDIGEVDVDKSMGAFQWITPRVAVDEHDVLVFTPGENGKFTDVDNLPDDFVMIVGRKAMEMVQKTSGGAPGEPSAPTISAE